MERLPESGSVITWNVVKPEKLSNTTAEFEQCRITKENIITIENNKVECK